ncbi:MAG: asparagine synthase (glutamine-hydrolyzing) [Lachnospiraceae bacterium]|nr:asparagine synthase (glutamine-hydrolyzing) [Lachnospiraceae bacterium]
MCGICGYISLKRVNKKVFASMNDSMIHRGPDDSGLEQFQVEEYQVGFAQRRLSILDLSKLGHQPMYSASGNSLITYNGEIYNFQEVKKVLNKKGVVFKSQCDTEVILEAYEEYGEECVNLFNGMFAFALFDFRRKCIFLARDRFGKKPLYYFYSYAEKTFVFSSTLQPIMNFPGFRKQINKEALYQYFYYGYISEPDSIFEEVYKLEPGSVLTLEIDSFSLNKHYYWNVYEAYSKASGERFESYDLAKSSLKNVLVKAVERRLIADVPLGTFLSGGIDSTLVTAIAQTVSNQRINTYSIGFSDKKYDESAYAEEISRYIGTNHHQFIVSEEDLFQMIDELPLYYDEPFSDSSQLPSMMVSRMAKTDITVAITGDGGDELFCGYAGYDSLLKMEKYKKFARFLYPVRNNKFIQEKVSTRLLSVICAANDSGCQWTSIALKRLIDRMLITGVENVKYDEGRLDQKDNIQIRRMLLDMSTYLPGDILHKMDRASMKYSLESRCPILDYKVAELSFRIPHQFKYRNGEKKYIMKDLTYEYVPKTLLDRPKKGFSVPLKKLLCIDSTKKELDKYTSRNFVNRQGLFHEQAILEIRNMVNGSGAHYEQSYVNNAVNILWNYLVFQKWYVYYLGE